MLAYPLVELHVAERATCETDIRTSRNVVRDQIEDVAFEDMLYREGDVFA